MRGASARLITGVVAILLLVALPGIASAAEWSGLTPGVNTQEAVRERYGAPSRESKQTLESYATTQWVYEGALAPVGMKRMVVDFGLLTAQGYSPTLIRAITLEPKPGIFSKPIVLSGWGRPDRAGTEEGREVFFYTSGLVVFFAPGGADAISLVFTIPQPAPSPAPQ